MDKKGINLLDVQKMNRSLLIKLLRSNNVWTRAKLAKATGLKRATISNIINDFLDWGLVDETGVLYGEKNRRSIEISLNSDKCRVTGIRLSRNFFSIGLFDLGGVEYSYKVKKIDAHEGPNIALEKIAKEVNILIKNSRKQNKIIGVCIALPGPYFRDEGRIGLMTEFPGWDKISIRDELKEAFDVPVYFEHDANAAAIAEWWQGKHSRKSGTLIFIFITEGVGAGIVIDGNLYRGNLGIAGEIGHTTVQSDGPKCECGNNGCLEHYCSTIALIREVKNELTNYPQSILNKDHSVKSILSAFNSGDKLAEKVVRKFLKFLSYGIVNVVNSFNPDTVIIGGDIIQGGPKLLEILKNYVKEHMLSEIYKNTILEFSSIKNDEVVLGSSLIVTNKVLQNPSLVKEYISK